jgi:AraC-like DNA-binding protein
VHFSDKVALNVDVAARLSPPLLSRLRVALGDGHTLIVAHEWGELAQMVRTRAIDAVVVEPRADGKTYVDEIRALVEQHPTLPVVVYAALSPETLRATIELARYGVQHVVLRGFDDESRRFRELIERLPAHRLASTVLQELAPRLAEGPPLLQRAVGRLFESPQTFRSVEDLAVAAGMTRRNLDRWLERLGLASARLLIFGARFTRALHYMRDPGYQLDDITRKVGYANPRLFARQVRAVTGLTPSAMRATVEPERALQLLTARLCRRKGAMNADLERARAGPDRG